MPALPELDFRRTPVTLIIAAVSVAMELVSSFDPSWRDYFYMDLKLGILSTIWTGAWWQPFTSSLLHGNLLHMGFNVAWLIAFGAVLEARFGWWRYLLLLVLLAYVTMLPQFVIPNFDAPVNAQRGAVGLSGIMYGLFGLLWMGRRWHREFYLVCDDTTVKLPIGWFFFCIAATYTGVMPVANIAHGAGIVFGVIYGLAIFDRDRRLRWTLLAAVASLAVLATMIGVPGHNGFEHARQIRQIQQMR